MLVHVGRVLQRGGKVGQGQGAERLYLPAEDDGLVVESKVHVVTRPPLDEGAGQRVGESHGVVVHEAQAADHVAELAVHLVVDTRREVDECVAHGRVDAQHMFEPEGAGRRVEAEHETGVLQIVVHQQAAVAQHRRFAQPREHGLPLRQERPALIAQRPAAGHFGDRRAIGSDCVVAIRMERQR